MGRLARLQPRVGGLGPGRLATLNPDSWRDGKTTAERGYGGAWQRARLAFFRDHPLCIYCQRQGRVTPAAVVDHKTPHKGDETLFWDESNWQSLCKPCHDIAKKREEAKLR